MDVVSEKLWKANAVKSGYRKARLTTAPATVSADSEVKSSTQPAEPSVSHYRSLRAVAKDEPG